MFRSVFRSFVFMKKWLNVNAFRTIRKSRPRPWLAGNGRARALLEELECRVNPSAPFVASSFFDSAVYEFNPGTGALVSTLVAPNSSPLLAGPAGLTLGPDGNLYISSQ